jgi:hypothetical protein
VRCGGTTQRITEPLSRSQNLVKFSTGQPKDGHSQSAIILGRLIGPKQRQHSGERTIRSCILPVSPSLQSGTLNTTTDILLDHLQVELLAAVDASLSYVM